MLVRSSQHQEGTGERGLKNTIRPEVSFQPPSLGSVLRVSCTSHSQVGTDTSRQLVRVQRQSSTSRFWNASQRVFSFHRSIWKERLCLEPQIPSDYHINDGGMRKTRFANACRRCWPEGFETKMAIKAKAQACSSTYLDIGLRDIGRLTTVSECTRLGGDKKRVILPVRSR
jgi:hypothetical protein